MISTGRLTYSDLKAQYLRNIGKGNSIDSNLQADFDFHLGQRYQLVLSRLADYMTQGSWTTETVASQQYYGYPPGMQSLDSVKITVGSVNYPISTIYSQHAWDVLNALQIQPTAIPQFIFPTKDDFGIWPIPQDVYTITFAGFNRDRNLAIDDYSTGTITLTQGSADIVGTNTTFTPAMVGRWLCVTDSTIYGQGYFYRIASYTSAVGISLDQPWQNDTTATAVAFKIGESPEIPEEGHVILLDGVTADFYGGQRDDNEVAQMWENKFWTGDRTNSARDTGNQNIAGGLIGLMNRYASRDKKRIISRQPKPFLPQYKVFATQIS